MKSEEIYQYYDYDYDTKSTCLVLLSSDCFEPHKNIPELVGITHRKPEYLEMCRMYVQYQK